VTALLLERATTAPAREAFRFVDTGASWTYGAFAARVRNAAAGFAGLGVRPGDHIALMLPNRIEFIESWFASTYLGAMHVPVNVYYKGMLLSYILNDCRARLIVIDAQYVDRLAAVSDDLEHLEQVVVCGDGYDTHGLERRFRVCDHGGLTSSATPIDPVQAEPWDPEGIVYTSGTTGPSKGAVVCHNHRLVMAEDWNIVNEITGNDVLYTCFPFFHALATSLGILPMMLVGGTTVVSPRFSASTFWDEVRAQGATYSHTIFSIPAILLKQAPTRRDKDHSVRGMYVGPSALSLAFEERFGARIVEIWGSGESGILTYSPPGSGQAPPGSCGRPNPRYELTILDDCDEHMPANQNGEIAVRPREPWILPLEYLGKPDQTIASLRNCWFRLGDCGYRDAQGNVYFVDRKKDSLRRRGENISSYEVEMIVSSYPGVLESAAIGIDSGLANGDQDVLVHVVPVPGAEIDPEQLLRYCDEKMPYFMVPRYFVLRDAMPKTPTEKIEKYVLRREGLPERAWDREAAGIFIKNQ